jgi:hypothetical protein
MHLFTNTKFAWLIGYDTLPGVSKDSRGTERIDCTVRVIAATATATAMHGVVVRGSVGDDESTQARGGRARRCRVPFPPGHPRCSHGSGGSGPRPLHAACEASAPQKAAQVARVRAARRPLDRQRAGRWRWSPRDHAGRRADLARSQMHTLPERNAAARLVVGFSFSNQEFKRDGDVAAARCSPICRVA